MQLSQKVESLLQALNNAQHIRILSHRNPDGDAISSMIVFAEICKHFSISFDLLLQDHIPENLLFLANSYPFHIVDSLDEFQLQNEKTDTVVCVDCGNFSRIGFFYDDILEHQQIINIDHHISNPHYGHLNIVEDISSTAELLYYILEELRIPLNLNIAQALYIGIVTDTGQFQFDKVTTQTHQIVSKLIENGVQPYSIYEHIYQQNPISWFKMLEYGLKNMDLYFENQVAILTFKKELQEFEDTHILFPLILATQSIKIAVIIKEKDDNSISASFRSKKEFNIETIAKNLGGGGHIHAAACRVKNTSIEDFKSMIYQELTYLFK